MCPVQGSAQNRSILFTFWKNLPIIKMIPSESFEYIRSHPIREAIVQVLRTGIEVEEGTRHALTMNELKEPVEKILQQNQPDATLKLTAMYHHRDILIEKGFIREIAEFLEGKRYNSYYGRTARAFIGEYDFEAKSKETNELTVTIIQHLQPDIDIDQLKEQLLLLEQEKYANHLALLEWIKDHVNLINELDLDALEVYDVLSRYYPQSTENQHVMKTIRTHLKLV